MFRNCIVALKIILIFTLLSSSQRGAAQDRSLANLDPYQAALLNSDPILTLSGTTTTSGKSSLVDENILLFPYWLNGIVNFNNGKQLRNVQLEFNLLKNELYFNNNNVPNTFVDSVKSFLIIDTSNGINRVATFCNGYPNLGQQTGKTYYLVVTSGPLLHLLKYVSKKKRDLYVYGSPMKTIYEITEDMFVYDVKSNALKAVKGTVNALNKVLPAYTAVIQNTLKDYNRKYVSQEEIINVVNQINTLQH